MTQETKQAIAERIEILEKYIGSSCGMDAIGNEIIKCVNEAPALHARIKTLMDERSEMVKTQQMNYKMLRDKNTKAEARIKELEDIAHVFDKDLENCDSVESINRFFDRFDEYKKKNHLINKAKELNNE